jgi:D-tagatose-1,6-bisphosphate aldolase subunit GatZ/KbaZ
LYAAIEQAVADGSILHVESTSNQVNQFGGYTGTTPAHFAEQIRRSAAQAGLPAERILLGADHLGPYCWRSESSAAAMAKASALAVDSVLAGYQKIHLDASMACADDPVPLLEETIAERTALLCRAAEESFASLPPGTTRPVYVIGTEVPVPGGEVGDDEPPAPTRPEDLEQSISTFRAAFEAHNLQSAWENVVGMVVQPGVEFGESSVFPYMRPAAKALVAALPDEPPLVYEAHSTDYQTEASLREMIEDHFAILKVGPWLTFAYREAIFVLSLIESEMPQQRRTPSQVRQMLELAMASRPAYWKPYYIGNEDEQRF